MSYCATDDDLPRNLWPDKDEPLVHEHRIKQDEMFRRMVQVQLHYPALEGKSKRQPRTETAASLREELDRVLGRKRYVRGAKRTQMRLWLEALDQQGALFRMNDWERRFVGDLLTKFRRWGARVKWITERQYRALETIATKYLHVPERTRNAKRRRTAA